MSVMTPGTSQVAPVHFGLFLEYFVSVFFSSFLNYKFVVEGIY